MKFVLAHDKDQNTERNRFSEEQIIGILKEHEAGVSVADLCRKQGVSNASILQMEGQVRLAGGLGGQAAEDAGGREHAAETTADAMLDNSTLKGPPGKEMWRENRDRLVMERGKPKMVISDDAATPS